MQQPLELHLQPTPINRIRYSNPPIDGGLPTTVTVATLEFYAASSAVGFRIAGSTTHR